MQNRMDFNSPYEGEHLNRVAFPMGGLGAGMLCLEGTGALSHVSLRHRPDIFNEPCVFSALSIKGAPGMAKVLEGPVPAWKVFGSPGCGTGGKGKTYGLPRFSSARFSARFPFAEVTLDDEECPVSVKITGWSPFIPADADASSLPVAALEYEFTNRSSSELDLVFSFNAMNFMAVEDEKPAVLSTQKGFILSQSADVGRGSLSAAFCAEVDSEDVSVNCLWFRGSWFDPLTIAWQDVAQGRVVSRPPVTTGEPSPGGSLYVPLRVGPGSSKRVRLMFSWYVPTSNLRTYNYSEGHWRPPYEAKPSEEAYRPWYSARFESIEEVAGYWRDNYDSLRTRTQKFSACFFDTNLPPEVVEAVSANLCILKSPTILRQHDGRLWCWEGCADTVGSCPGTCTHVWNYAQATAHLFPQLERTLRETEFFENQDDTGHQTFRALLPIRPTKHDFLAAADGQFGGVMKVYRDWRISGDTDWLRSLWPRVKDSLNYGIQEWDPNHRGVLTEPHHNTYDIEFWGPNGMCTSLYLGALKAGILMGQALGEDVSLWQSLLAKGCEYLETRLFDGEYLFQDVVWTGLRAGDPTSSSSLKTTYSPEALELLKKEGPKYQYGTGCLSDGVLGAWMAEVCGVGSFLENDVVRSTLCSIYRYNFRRDLSKHANPQRPTYALGNEGGLLLCTWPKGGAPSLPFIYSNEVWTGIEYQVASHLIIEGMVDEGLEIVRTCRRRYDGRVRNPFNEYECGHWYGRALSSYALIYGLTGVRYDAVDKKLYITPRIKGDFRSFISTATGYGTVGVRDGEPFYEMVEGSLDVREIVYTPFRER